MWNILESVSSLFNAIKLRKNKTIICIEGNISSGKSTTVNELKEMFKDNKRVCFLLEPLAIWESIRDNENNNTCDEQVPATVTILHITLTPFAGK